MADTPAWEILAFDFGNSRGRCALCTRSGQRGPAAAFQRAEGEDGPLWLKRMLEAGKKLHAESGAPKLSGVGVSFGGPVFPDGRIFSHHVSGWEHVNLAAEMRAAFGAPCAVDNDGNLGGFGEQRYGAGRGVRDLLYLTVSTGIGGGVILNGQVHRGANGLAGEIGHMPITPLDPNAPECTCHKRGCLESLASGPAIEALGREALKHAGRAVPQGFTSKNVFEAVAQGEAWALATRERAVNALAQGIAGAVCILDTKLVVLGGGVTLAADLLFAPLRERFEEFLPPVLRGKCRIEPAALGDFAPLMGACALACEAGA